MQILIIVLLSLGAGALIATMALSLLLTYRSSGVVNFAAGATAGFIAYAYWNLTTNGRLFIGVDIPLSADGAPISPLIALPICIAEAALLGLLQYVLVYRPLRNAGALAKVVASSGVLLVLQALPILAFGSHTFVVKSILPSTTILLGQVSVPLDRAIIVGFAILAAAALSIVYRFTPFGITTRAAADSRKGALLLGVNPGRLEAANWVIASTITGLIGIFVSPLIGLTPTSMSLYIVPALGAVLLAGFGSFWIAAAAGIAIGAAQGLITLAQGFDWFPQSNGAPLPGIKEALPFVLIAIVLFARGRNVPDRLMERTRLPRAPRPNKLPLRFGVAIALGLGIILLAPYGWRQALITSLIGAIVCMSIVVITGYLGQVTLAQMAIAGGAGFILSKVALALGIGFPLGPIIAIAAASAVSLLVALPALRMRGMQLAMVTLAGAVAIQSVWFLNPEFGGGTTAANVPAASFLGNKLGSADSFWNYSSNNAPSPGFALFVLIVTCIVAFAVVSVRRSAFGARMLAVRADEAASAAAGVDVSRTKLIAFAFAGAIAGVAGVLYGYDFGLVTSSQFDVFTAIAFLAVAYLGGLTTVTGAVIGGLLVTQGIMMYTVTTLFGIPSEFQLLIAGVAVLATVIGNPDGIAGFFRDRVARGAVRLRSLRSQGNAPAAAQSAKGSHV